MHYNVFMNLGEPWKLQITKDNLACTVHSNCFIGFLRSFPKPANLFIYKQFPARCTVEQIIIKRKINARRTWLNSPAESHSYFSKKKQKDKKRVWDQAQWNMTPTDVVIQQQLFTTIQRMQENKWFSIELLCTTKLAQKKIHLLSESQRRTLLP